MTTSVRLLPKQWHRGTVTNRVDAIQLNQTLEKLMVDVRQFVLNMMNDGCIDIFSIPDKLKRLRSGNINFLDFCDTRMKIRQYGKAADSQERYTRFMKFFRSWGKIVEFEISTYSCIMPLILVWKVMATYPHTFLIHCLPIPYNGIVLPVAKCTRNLSCLLFYLFITLLLSASLSTSFGIVLPESLQIAIYHKGMKTQSI